MFKCIHHLIKRILVRVKIYKSQLKFKSELILEFKSITILSKVIKINFMHHKSILTLAIIKHPENEILKSLLETHKSE